jgi:hypothetical protein
MHELCWPVNLKQCNIEIKTNKNLLRPSKRLNIAYSNYGALIILNMTLAAYLSVSFSFMDLYMYSDAQTFFTLYFFIFCKSSLEEGSILCFFSCYFLFYSLFLCVPNTGKKLCHARKVLSLAFGPRKCICS